MMPKVATGFYAVCKGREIGVFTTWYVPLVGSSRPVRDRAGSVPAIVVQCEVFSNCG